MPLTLENEMNAILKDLLGFMKALGAESGVPFDDSPECLEAWRQALRAWYEGGLATIEEVEAFDDYIATRLVLIA